MKVVPEQFVFFWKDFVGQWTIDPFFDLGVEYCCTEQYMMHRKALLFKDYRIAAVIMETTSPKEMQRLGRMIANYDQKKWDECKFAIVLNGNRLRFGQNPSSAQRLCFYDSERYVEASPYDKVWGVGLGENDPLILDPTNWKGCNLLGEVLNIVRDELFQK